MESCPRARLRAGSPRCRTQMTRPRTTIKAAAKKACRKSLKYSDGWCVQTNATHSRGTLWRPMPSQPTCWSKLLVYYDNANAAGNSHRRRRVAPWAPGPGAPGEPHRPSRTCCVSVGAHHHSSRQPRHRHRHGRRPPAPACAPPTPSAHSTVRHGWLPTRAAVGRRGERQKKQGLLLHNVRISMQRIETNYTTETQCRNRALVLVTSSPPCHPCLACATSATMRACVS